MILLAIGFIVVVLLAIDLSLGRAWLLRQRIEIYKTILDRPKRPEM
jgi:hypothetical protein